MRRHRLAILVGFVVSLCIATAQEPPPVSFKTEVNYVEVGAVVTDEQGLIRTESLSNSFPGSEISILLKTYPPGLSRTMRPRGHEGEEFLHVLEGTLRVVVGEEEYVLAQGDSLHFKSTRPHAYESMGDQPCVVFRRHASRLFSRKAWPEHHRR